MIPAALAYTCRPSGRHGRCKKHQKRFRTTSAGFEPTRAEPTRFRGWRLNHSAMMPKIQRDRARRARENIFTSKRFRTTSAGFEPTWAEPTRFRVWRLNHSAMMPRARPGRHLPLLSHARPRQKSDTFSICACHPCAGAMLIFSVSFQF